MFVLAGDIRGSLSQIGLADREVCITALPLEIGPVLVLFLQPFVGDAFNLLNPLGLSDRAAKTRQQVHVIFYTPDQDRRTIEAFGNLTEIGVQRPTNVRFAKPWTPFLGRV